MSKTARILAIAGSDSSGGAGIQADIKTITMLGGYAMTAITAVTAQDTTAVHAVETLPPEMVAAQIDACLGDIGADAVKIGMLGSADIAKVVADKLEQLDLPIVFDPVMVATSGAALADDGTIEAFERLARIATLTTPNIPELEVLSARKIEPNELSLQDAGNVFMEATGAPAVLAKGGHWPGGAIHQADGRENSTDDLIFDCLYKLSPEGHWSERVWHDERIDTRHTHGTGCTLSSAIATFMGQGIELAEAIGEARQFVRRALIAAPGFGSGHGPMGHHAAQMPQSRS